MTNNTTIKKLADWIQSLIDEAEEDNCFDIAWFRETENEKFSIIGGWHESGFDPAARDIFCTSKSQPKYVMAIKVAINNGPYAYCDFDTMDMPIDKFGDVDDTLFILEWDMEPKALATFIYGEWERIMKEHQED